MKKILFSLLFSLITLTSLAQLPGPVIGTAVAIPAGSFNCSQQSFGAPIGISGEPSDVTFCFNYFNVGPVTLSFILVSGLCGPFPLYNSLSFTVYDSAGTNLVASGTIVPTANNNNLSILMPGTWYTICYTWTPNCAQFSGCPLIYTSVLPIDLLYFKGGYSNEMNASILTWATATEKNVDKYIIQRTYDLISYETVAEVDAVGNSTTTNEYVAYDYVNLTSTVYYKLIEITIDGQEIIHDIISVNNKFIIDNTITNVYDITGKELKQLEPGVNVVKQGSTYFKVIQLK